MFFQIFDQEIGHRFKIWKLNSSKQSKFKRFLRSLFLYYYKISNYSHLKKRPLSTRKDAMFAKQEHQEDFFENLMTDTSLDD